MPEKTEPKECARCGATFNRPSDVSRGKWKKRRFCSPRCGAEARWDAVRAAKKGGVL
jgi:ribosomal protein S27AE